MRRGTHRERGHFVEEEVQAMVVVEHHRHIGLDLPQPLVNGWEVPSADMLRAQDCQLVISPRPPDTTDIKHKRLLRGLADAPAPFDTPEMPMFAINKTPFIFG